jgi:N-acyl-D-amino-acid deacylase
MRFVLLAVLLAPALLASQSPTYDLILRGGRVVDGTAAPWYRADVAIKGDTSM